MVNIRSREICALALSLIVLADISIIWDIPFFRQLFGFVLLIFLPGFLLIQIVRLTKDPVEKTLFLVGLSIAFLMFVPLVIDLAFLKLGISNPISLFPLVTTFSVILAGLTLVAYKTGALDLQITSTDFEALADRMKSPEVLGVILILVLGIMGALLIRFDLDSLFSLFSTVSIVIAVILIVVSRRISPAFTRFASFSLPSPFNIAARLRLQIYLGLISTSSSTLRTW